MPNKVDKNELLKDITEANAQNETLQKYVIDYIIKQFPIEGKTNTLELKEISLDASKIDPMDLPLQKEIKLKGGTWALPIYGSLVLRNNKTGEIIDESKKTRLLNLPIVTNRYSMIIDGSEYQTINQLRLKSGIYTRIKENGELESWFDLEKGYNFKMIFDPDTKLFYLVLANKKFKVYPILKALGFPDEDIKRAWGKEIYEENQRLGLNKDLKEIPELVEKLTKKKPANYEEAMKGLVDYLNYTKVDKETTKLTLGESFDKVSAETLFATSKKILGILRGTDKPDERDSLVFKNIYTPAALLGAFMDKKVPAIEASLRYRTDSKTQIKDIISSDTYTKPFKSFYTTGDLSSTPEQTNPISILNEWRKTTVMGTGGVKSDHAITLGVRDVHPSHFGFLDALGSPESGRVGVTLPLAVDVVSTDDNILRKQIVLSSGKKKYITPTEAATLSIAFPDQWVWKNGKPSAKSSKVNVMRNGEVVAVPPTEVDAWIENSWSLWSWPTNLVPFLPNNDAVRASFGSKMTSQAIALDQRESPNVESRIGGGKLGDITFEQAIGKYLSPIVPYELKKGVVTKITDDYIFIRPDGEKTEDKIGLFNNFPLNRETFLHSTPKVKVGDEVRAGDILAHLNFQDPKTDGLAYGLNVNVAYMPWKGMNYEDSCVITESLAKRMTSTKIITESLLVGKEGVLNLQKFRAYFPGSLTDKEASILDEEGVVKVGSWVEPNQTIIAYLEKKDLTDSERILRSMNKSMYSPFSNKSVIWHGVNKAQVIYVNRLSGGKIVVHLKESSPMVVGDKLAGRHGNKSCPSNYLCLTKQGWKYIKDVRPEIDLVATLNQQTHEFEWQPPSEVHEYTYSGKMYKVSGGDQIFLESTPDHRQFGKLRNCKRTDPAFNNFQIFNPEEQFGKRKKFCRWAKWTTADLNIDKNLPISVEGKELDFFKWVGYYVSEGWTQRTTLAISQSERNVQELKEIESLFNVIFDGHYKKVIKNIPNAKSNIYQVYHSCTKPQSEYFKEQFGHKAGAKKIPTWMKEAPVEYLKTLLYGLIKGDGSEECNRIRYFTVSQTLAHDIAEIGIKCGYAVNITTREQKLCKINDVQVKSSQLLYTVALNAKQGLEPLVNGNNNAVEEWVDYSGNMVCLTVPNGVFLTTSDEKFIPIWTGNSIVSRIIPDDEAPHTLDGKRIDLILSPNGIPGRMNAGQLLETAAGKIADKANKKYLIDNFDGENHLKDIQDKLKQHGLKDKDILLDGKDGKPFLNPVFNGNQYILKLMHTVDHKTKSRSYGSYSIEEQPSRGDEGGQKIDPLSTFALLAHGARENLREFAAVKSQKNDEIWAAIQTGQPIPPPRSNFAFEKLLVQLKGVGINVNKAGNTMTLEPMIDSEILEMSSGKITDAGKMLIGKNLDAIKGGIFDKEILGGVKGKKWGHIELEERMPNPLYQKPIMVILGLTDPQFKRVIAGEEKLPNGLTGPKGIEEALRKLDVDAEFEKAKKDLVSAPRNGVNKLNQKVRYLEAVKRFNKNPAELYMLKYVPVMPPIYRPIMTLGSGDTNVAPINHNYRFLALANNDLKHYKAVGMEKEFGPKARLSLYEELSNTVGLSQSTRPDIARKTEGVIMSIAGKNTPKFGYAHNKLWGKRQDLSGRSTITLDPSLGLDEVGLPANIYKKVFLPFAVREMVNQGLSPLEARQNILDDTPLAQNAFELAMKNRPVLMNRAPSLHKHSVQAHIAKPTSGASIKLNPLIVTGYNADFDGDTMSVHVPVSSPAVEEAYTMLPSKNIWQSGSKSNVPASAFSKDYMLGLWQLTKEEVASSFSFKTLAEANAAYKADKIKMNHTFLLNGHRTSLGRQLVIKTLPQSMQAAYDKVITKKDMRVLLDEIAKTRPNDFASIIDALKDIALQFGHSYASTISLEDLDIDRSFRDKILIEYKKKEDPKWSTLEKANHWLKAQNEIVAAQNDYIKNKGKARGFFDMLDSGAESKQDSVRQLITMPGVKIDVYGKPLAQPIIHSYAEGLNQGEYWMSLYGARKGMVDRSINTEQSGAINKSLLGVTKSLLVVEADCGTTEGVEIDINDTINLMDRYLAIDIPGIAKAGELNNNTIISKVKAKKINTMWLRSPLTCETPHGICQKCYGIAEDGNLVAIGTNVGIKAGQTTTERATQLTLKSFHSGGSAAVEQDVVAGFPRMEQLLKVPEILSNKATLASIRGTVHRIEKSAIGGYDVYISGVKHHIPYGRTILVKTGDDVQEGDALSSGAIKPQELATYKGYQAARLQIVKDLEGVFGKEGLGKRTFETVLRGIANQVTIDEAPEDTEYYRGDNATLSKVLAENKQRRLEGKEEIKFTPYFKSIDTLALDNPDWLSKLTVNRIKETLKDGAALGSASNLHGTDPMPSYLQGTEFNTNVDFSKGRFY